MKLRDKWDMAGVLLFLCLTIAATVPAATVSWTATVASSPDPAVVCYGSSTNFWLEDEQFDVTGLPDGEYWTHGDQTTEYRWSVNGGDVEGSGASATVSSGDSGDVEAGNHNIEFEGRTGYYLCWLDEDENEQSTGPIAVGWMSIGSKGFTVVEVASVSCSGITSTTDTPGDAETVYVAIGAEDATVTISATPSPGPWPSGKPTWSITNPDGSPGDGQTSINALIDTAGTYAVSATCGDSTVEIILKVIEVELDAWFENIDGIVHTTVMPNYCSPHYVYTPFDHFYATVTPEVSTLSLVLERVGIDPDTGDKGTVYDPYFWWNAGEHRYEGPWYSSKAEASGNKCADDPVIQDQTVTFAVKMDGQILDTVEVTVRSGFNYLVSRGEQQEALDLVCAKYASVIGASQWNSIVPGAINGTSLLNNVTISDFTTENYCAGVIGHENLHCGQSTYLRWLAQGGAMTESLRLYWEAVMEIPAYQWQLDHASGLCLSQDEIDIVQTALDFYIQQMNDNTP